MKTQIFKVQAKGIKNETTNAFLSKENFKTKKGQYNKRFINYLSKLTPAQLNQVSTKYNIPQQELFTLIPEDKRNFVLDITQGVDNQGFKFYNTKWIKSRLDENKFEIQNNKVVVRDVDYVNEYKKQLVKLNQKKIKQIKVNLNRITLLKAVELARQYIQTERPLVKIIEVDGDTSIYTLNDDIIKKIREGDISGFKLYQSDKKGSDAEIVNSALKNKIIYITVVRKIKNTKPKGDFFPYWNLTDIDLSRYDIYNKNQKDKLNKDNCFYIALKNLGLHEDKLNQLKFLIGNGTVPLSKLNEICEILKIKINLLRYKKDYKETVSYGSSGNLYEICVYLDHYFINEIVDFTTYSAKHYQEIKSINNMQSINTIIKCKNGKYEKSSNDKYKISSFNLVYLLFQDQNNFEKMDFDTLIEHSQIDIDNFDFTSLEYSENNTRIIEFKPKEVKKYTKIYFDLETYVDKEQDNKHMPYIVGYASETTNSKDLVINGYFSGSHCVKDFLNYLCKNYNEDDSLLLLAHNAKYDNSFLLSQVHIKSNGIIYKDGAFYSMDCIYRNNGRAINLKVVDTYKKISMSLSAFGKSFNLTQEKELMPYNLYNDKNPTKYPIRSLDECLKYVEENQHNHFIDNCNKFKCIDENLQVDIIKYSAEYCIIDCKVLKQGYEKFNEMVKEAFDINADDFLTISSMADYIINKKGCYEGVYEISGIPRAFIQRSVVGGRVMCAENKKRIVKGKLADYDACSLYPSAMYRLGKDLGGFLKGTPKVIQNNDLNMNFLNKQDGYFVKIRINKVNKHLKFPLLNKKNDGVREFINNMESHEDKQSFIYIDKISLEDAIKFQNIEFDILQGYYFNEGRNNKITEVIKNLYDERVKLKQQKNPAQIVYKLLLNSVYGKTILKASDTKTEIINENKYEKFINYHYNDLKNLVVLDGNKYLAQTKTSINDHFNKAQIGSEILAMSKRIMNEVITTAEDNNLNVYYQDTDSLHIDFDDVKILEDKYYEKYNKVLKGEDLGNFHIDFELKGADSEIYATDSIFLGKKCYIDRLECVNKNNDIVNGYHIRMKGISTESINHYCNVENITPIELYNNLYKGDEITFDLTAGKTIFKYNNIGSVKTVSEFTRKIKF
jgi:hypothetical protein